MSCPTPLCGLAAEIQGRRGRGHRDQTQTAENRFKPTEVAKLSLRRCRISLDKTTALPYMCNMQIVATKTYSRKVRKILTEAERNAAEAQIAADPTNWPVIAGTGGVRKARAMRGSSGKRGGARVIYYAGRATTRSFCSPPMPRAPRPI